jgi:outer membrane protein OmpA-like peptidoglycan-associated protein
MMFRAMTCWFLCGFLAFSVTAEEMGESDPWSISVMGGVIDYEGDEAVDSADLFSLLLSYDLNDRVRLEVGIHRLDSVQEDFRFDVARGEAVSRLEESAGVNETDGFALSLESLWRIGKPSRFDPYVAVGVGLLEYDDTFDSSPEASLRSGFGFLYHFNDSFALRGDARVIMAGSDSEFNGYYSAGVTWTPSMRRGVKDSDQDGLSNADERRIHRTNPRVADSDFDGLSDGREIQELGTDPLAFDTDGGGVSDGHEVLVDKTDPNMKSDDAARLQPAIEFETAGAEIREEYFSELDIVGRVLGQGAFKGIQIESHVFSASTADAQQLSQQRAEAVRAYLLKKWKLDATIAVAVGLGDSSPRGNKQVKTDRIEIFAK